MKTCPMLWQKPTGGRTNLIEKNCDISQASAATGTSRHGGKGQECLGNDCRFWTETNECGIETMHTTVQILDQRLVDSEERWENVLLTLVELTERINSVIDRQEKWTDNPTPTEDNPVSQETTETAETAETPETPEDAEQDERSRTLDANLARARDENATGIDYYHDANFVEARNCFRRALKLVPDFVEAHNNLGLIETELGNIEEATAHFRQAIVLSPDLSASYTNLGYVFYLQESYIEAVAMYEEALQRAEDSSTAWTNLGNAHFKLGNFGKARHAWEKAIDLDPGNERAVTNLERMAEEEPC